MAASGLVISQIQGVTVVNLQNTSILDAATTEAIAAELFALTDQQAQRKLVLDFSAVRFFSSQLIGVLIALDKKARAIKGRVVLCGLRADLFRIFQIMNLHKKLNFTEDEEKALNSFDVFTC